MNTEEWKSIVTDKDISSVWGNANFGHDDHRRVIDDAVLHSASGYSNGHTAECIIKELGLLSTNNRITKKGKVYLYSRFKSLLADGDKS